MSDSLAGGSDRYIEGLLRSALALADERSQPMAGRVMVRLLAVVSVSGSHSDIAKYLSPAPDAHATFEVRSSRPRDTEAKVIDGLNAAVAIREALHLTRGDSDRVDVVARTAEGVERRVLARDTDGGLTFLFPGPDTYQGPEHEVRAALDRWAGAMVAWRTALEGLTAWSAPEEPTSPDSLGDVDMPPPAGPNGGIDQRSSLPAESPPEQVEPATRAEEVVRRLQSSLGDISVDVNLAEMESWIRRSVGEAISARLGAAVVLGAAGGLGGPNAAELADRVAARVTEQVAQMLSSTGDAGVPGQLAVLTRILGAVEALEVQMTALREQERISSGVLQTLTDQTGRDARRTDSTVQRLEVLVSEELDRLGRRIEDQLAELQDPSRRRAVRSGGDEVGAPGDQGSDPFERAVGSRGRFRPATNRRPKDPGPG